MTCKGDSRNTWKVEKFLEAIQEILGQVHSENTKTIEAGDNLFLRVEQKMGMKHDTTRQILTSNSEVHFPFLRVDISAKIFVIKTPEESVQNVSRSRLPLITNRITTSATTRKHPAHITSTIRNHTTAAKTNRQHIVHTSSKPLSDQG